MTHVVSDPNLTDRYTLVTISGIEWRYGPWTIRLERPPIPLDVYSFVYQDDAEHRKSGYAHRLEDAVACIDAMLPHCDRCDDTGELDGAACDECPSCSGCGWLLREHETTCAELDAHKMDLHRHECRRREREREVSRRIYEQACERAAVARDAALAVSL